MNSNRISKINKLIIASCAVGLILTITMNTTIADDEHKKRLQAQHRHQVHQARHAEHKRQVRQKRTRSHKQHTPSSTSVQETIAAPTATPKVSTSSTLIKQKKALTKTRANIHGHTKNINNQPSKRPWVWSGWGGWNYNVYYQGNWRSRYGEDDIGVVIYNYYPWRMTRVIAVPDYVYGSDYNPNLFYRLEGCVAQNGGNIDQFKNYRDDWNWNQEPNPDKAVNYYISNTSVESNLLIQGCISKARDQAETDAAYDSAPLWCCMQEMQ